MSDNHSNMTDSEYAKCHAIIHSAAVAAGGVGAGLAQIPMSDNLVIMPIQIGMVASLGNVFGKTLGESAITSLISAAAGTVVGRSVSQALLGWLPGIGNVINASTAFTLTEAIGWSIANNFAIEKRREEEEYRGREEEATPISFEEALSSPEEEYRERFSAAVKNGISRIISGIIAAVKRAVLFVFYLPKAVVYSLGDIAISVRNFILMLWGLVTKPFRVVPLLFVKIWEGLRSLCAILWKGIQIIAPALMIAKISLYVIVKFNVFPGLQTLLTTALELIDLVN